jgi:hypothetical protein
MTLTTESGRGLVIPARSTLEGHRRIRITSTGVGKVILMRSDWPEGAELTVSKNDGDYFVREGWGELAVDAPTPEVVEEVAEEEGKEPEPETATAEPAGETATQRRPPRRRKGHRNG